MRSRSACCKDNLPWIKETLPVSGLGSGVQCLITFDYWVDDADRLTAVWDTVMESLTLGLYISDPRTGLAFPD